jgi:hypothetical protein
MRHTTTAIAMDPQPPLTTIYPTTPALPTQEWRPAALLHVLYTWVTSFLRPSPFESRWIRPELIGWEAPTDILARRHTYLYIHSMSG